MRIVLIPERSNFSNHKKSSSKSVLPSKEILPFGVNMFLATPHFAVVMLELPSKLVPLIVI